MDREIKEILENVWNYEEGDSDFDLDGWFTINELKILISYMESKLKET
jgi:hypothetical protein